MSVGELFLLTEATFLVFGAIFSLFVLVPVTSNYREYGNRCLLFAVGEAEGKSTEYPEVNITSWGSPGLCHYSICLSALILCWSVLILAYTSYHLIRDSNWSWLWAFALMCVHAFLFVLVIGSCLTVSIGFSRWCYTVTRNLISCREVEIYLGQKKDSGDFYIQYTIAMIGAWSLCLTFLVLLLTSARRVCVYHRNESITLRMRRERHRLLPTYKQHPEYQVL